MQIILDFPYLMHSIILPMVGVSDWLTIKWKWLIYYYTMNLSLRSTTNLNYYESDNQH